MSVYLKRMFRYVAWADRQIVEAVRAAPADARSEVLPLLAHLLAAEHIWLSRLEQRTPRLPVRPELGFAECDALAAENAAGYRALLERLRGGGDGDGDDDPDGFLNAPVRFRIGQGPELACPARDILDQVITHGAYHRGQITRIIDQAGGAVDNTDFILYALQVEPAAGCG